MLNEYIDITRENVALSHLCCIIRKKPGHHGIEAKRAWLAERLDDGHVFRRLDTEGIAFIEYAPLERAWVPIEGNGYIYIYCLWTDGALKGKGHGTELMESCIADARSRGSSGVCLLGAETQKHWLTSQDFAKRFGFVSADKTKSGYELLALSFDGTLPRFTESAKRETVDMPGLAVYYSHQCPYIPSFIEKAAKYCDDNGITAAFINVDSLEAARAMPCPFNNCAVFWEGRFITVNLPDTGMIGRLVKRQAPDPKRIDPNT